MFVLPIFVAWIQVVGTYFASRHEASFRDYDVGATLLLAGTAALLLWRRSHPVPVLVGTVALTLVYWTLGYPRGPVFIAEAIALICAILSRHRAAAIAIVAIASPLSFWLPDLFDTREPPTFAEGLGAIAWIFALIAGAEFFRSRRDAAIAAAKTRTEERKRRASEERMEIARELHDVLAHNISLINVQANVGLHLMNEKPEQATTALSAIKEVSGETLLELRSVLDILRAGGTEAPRSPTSGLAHLDDLLERSRTAGLEVAKLIEGRERPVPREVDLAAFRIIQEGLTNVRRHSGAPAARVTLTYDETALGIGIEDAGSGKPVTETKPGRGIEGMRERALALGGSFVAAPKHGGGFIVKARLPLPTRGET